MRGFDSFPSLLRLLPDVHVVRVFASASGHGEGGRLGGFFLGFGGAVEDGFAVVILVLAKDVGLFGR